jgi:hypothetical protein
MTTDSTQAALDSIAAEHESETRFAARRVRRQRTLSAARARRESAYVEQTYAVDVERLNRAIAMRGSSAAITLHA